MHILRIGFKCKYLYVTNDEAMKAYRDIGMKVTVLCISTRAGEECRPLDSAVSHRENSLVPRVSLDVLKKAGIIYKQATKLGLFKLQMKCW